MNAYGWLADVQQHLLTTLILAALCVTATYTDLRSSRIPNRVTVFYTLMGIGHQVLLFGGSGVKNSLVGLCLGFCAVWVLYACKGVGAGDVKLFAAIGSIVGWAPTLHILLYSILLSGLIGGVILVYDRWKSSGSFPIFHKLQWLWLNKHQGIKLRTARDEPLRFPFMLAVSPAVLLLYGSMYF